MFSRVEIRLARNKLSGKAYNIQQAILHSWTTNIPVVVNRFVHESAVTIWFLSASATYSFRVISGENSCIHSLWRGEKKRGKKEKNSDRPIPLKLFRRLPFLNAIHSVNKKEERLDTMVAGYYLLANYTWAGSGENFRPGYNKPSYPSSLPPPPPSLPPFLSIHLTPLRRTYFQPVQLLDRLEPCLLWPPCTTCTCNVRQHLLRSPPLLTGRVTESYNASPSCSRSRYRLI